MLRHLHRRIFFFKIFCYEVIRSKKRKSALLITTIEGDDMSDGDDDHHGQQRPKKGRSIFETIIAKWSSFSAPGQEHDSDEDDDGALSGCFAGIESGQPHARTPSLCVSLPAPSSGRLRKWTSLPRARAPETSMLPARIPHARARLLAPARVPMQTTTTTTMA